VEALLPIVVGILIVLWNVYEDLWNVYEDREYERRKTRPERARKATRQLEIDILARMGAENHLRRILIADLQAHLERQRAKAWIKEEFGLDLSD
jgi:hypothetical protein